MHIMYYQGDRELAFAKNLRALCIAEMDRIGDAAVGARLNLLPGGVERLRWKIYWDVEKAVRVAILLDIPVMQALENAVAPR